MTEIIEFLSPSEVAAILKVHVKTVHIWLRQGKLKGTKISYRTWRIPKDALDDFLTGKTFLSRNQSSDSYEKISPGPEKQIEREIPATSLASEKIDPGTGKHPGEMKYFLKEIMKDGSSDKK